MSSYGYYVSYFNIWFFYRMKLFRIYSKGRIIPREDLLFRSKNYFSLKSRNVNSAICINSCSAKDKWPPAVYFKKKKGRGRNRATHFFMNILTFFPRVKDGSKSYSSCGYLHTCIICNINIVKCNYNTTCMLWITLSCTQLVNRSSLEYIRNFITTFLFWKLLDTPLKLDLLIRSS